MYHNTATMETSYRIGDVVKYKAPEQGEEDQRFIVLEIHEAEVLHGLPEKLHLELICDLPFKPTSCEFSYYFEIV